MPHLELRSLEKRYANNSDAVKGISFTAEEGEFIVLVGPSGCGKSTTLRMIAGLEEATGGDIFIKGKRVNDVAPKDRDVAMVFQNYALYPHLSVAENIGFPLEIRKTSKEIIKQEVAKAAELLSISHLLGRKPKELSGGERQRVAVGRAIVRKPQIFLFDEPLSNLDAALRTEMRAELKRLQRQLGATMVYVTHDQTEAMTMGDKIVVLNNGSIEQFGTPQDTYAHPRSLFVARFLGSPPMNMLNGTITTRDGICYFVSGEYKLPLNHNLPNGKKVIVGIRPEHFSISHSSNSPSDILGTLTLVERLGSSMNFYIDSGLSTDGKLSASSPQPQDSISYQIGEDVFFHLNVSDVHLFDADSGLRMI
ncbi:MAG: sn-glycerol-3-phosphate ABC transporter ATP-binding protein UgpC [bacterium]